MNGLRKETLETFLISKYVEMSSKKIMAAFFTALVTAKNISRL